MTRADNLGAGAVKATGRRGFDAGPVRQRKAAELAADALRQYIVESGKAGEYLPTERELLERLGISRPTLREALRVLESEGLLEIRRGARGGSVVRETAIDPLARSFGVHLQRKRATLHELNETRLIIEPAAARLAAERFGMLDAQVARILDEALGQEASAIADDDEARILEATTRFHDVVRELCGNEVIVVIGQLLDELIRLHAPDVFRHVSQRDDAARQRVMRGSHRAHIQLANAIRAGNADEAERLAQKHISKLTIADPRARVPGIDMFTSASPTGHDGVGAG